MEEQFYYTSKEVMEMLNVKSYKTLRRWEKNKILVPIKSPLGRYLYPKEEIDRFLAPGVK